MSLRGSILVQVMAWCLTAPSHYLDQCWRLGVQHRTEISVVCKCHPDVLQCVGVDTKSQIYINCPSAFDPTQPVYIQGRPIHRTLLLLKRKPTSPLRSNIMCWLIHAPWSICSQYGSCHVLAPICTSASAAIRMRKVIITTTSGAASEKICHYDNSQFSIYSTFASNTVCY